MSLRPDPDRGTRAPGWPATLRDGPVEVRPLRLADARDWRRIRAASAGWLIPWEATAPGRRAPQRPSLWSYASTWSRLRRQADRGWTLPFAVVHEGAFAGQVTVGGITRIGPPSAYVGYWIDRELAGRGIIPTALAMVVDHCFAEVGLERIEANVRPENVASRRVVEKLGFALRGTRTRFLYIDGEWRDHLCYVIAPGDVPEGLLARWKASRGARPM
ncbi:MAG: GNAT family N-acetyltransferase [Frankiaceae bacterium]